MKRHPGLLSFAVLAFALLALPFSAPALGMQKVRSSAFDSAWNCTACHDDFVSTWSRSMHAQAITDPIYLHDLRRAQKAGGSKLATFCESCHAPIAVMGSLDPLKTASLPPQAREGVTCDFCHQVSGIPRKVGNASFRVNAPGPKRAQFGDSGSAAHETAYSPLHETAEFCGTCHDVFHPTNGLQLEGTYTEWKKSPYAAKKIYCQECHMTPGPGVKSPNPGAAAIGGPQREHIYTMTFAGGNVGLGDAVRAEQMLKSAAKVRIEAPSIAPSGGKANVKVGVRNVGAGHYLPTGVTYLRQMWLEVTATDANGDVVGEARRDFGTVLRDEAGNEHVDAWDAVAVASDDRIAPGKEAIEQMPIPTDAKRPVTVRARLRYRSVSNEVASVSGVEIPTTEMASETFTIYQSEAQQSGFSPALLWGILASVGGGVGAVVLLRHQRRRPKKPTGFLPAE